MFKRDNYYVKKSLYNGNTQEKMQWCNIASLFWVKRYYVDICGNNSMLQLGYLTVSGAKATTKLFDRRMIAEKEFIPFLLAYGIDIYINNQQDLMNYIYFSEQEDAEIVDAYTKLGWIQDKLFLSNKIIDFSDRTKFGKYIGDLYGGYTIKGSPEIWYKGIEQLVIPYPRVCLVFVLSFLSVIISLLKRIIDCPEVFIEFSGKSSKGKSSMLMLAASSWGNPDMSENSIVKSANATMLALETRLSNHNGVPVFIDETTTIPAENVNNFIYNVTSGTSKSRCTSTGALANITSWSGALLTSSEESMRYKSNLRDGANVRSLFIDFICTNSAQHASDIKKLVSENYGFGNIPFVNGVMDIGKERLGKCVLSEAANFINAVKDAGLADSEFLERRSKLMGAIMTTAFMLKHVFRFNIRFGELRALLLEIYDSEYGCADIDNYERLKQLIFRDEFYFNSCLYGKFQKNDKKFIVYVTTTKFDEYCKILGIQSPRAFLAELKEINAIHKHDKGRNTCRVKINGVLQNTYALAFDDVPLVKSNHNGSKGPYEII